MDKVNDSAGKFEVDVSKQEASKMMEQVRANIQVIKEQVGDPGIASATQVLDSSDPTGDPFAKSVLAGINDATEETEEDNI
jgi:hypothetical protein